MKRFILAAAVALMGLVSCEKELSDAIVGTWEATTVEMTIEGLKMEIDVEEAGMEMSFTFKSNGTGSVTERYEGESFTESFEYYVEDDMLYLVGYLVGEGGTEGLPIEIDGKNMTMIFGGEMLDPPGSRVKMHFRKK